MCGVVVVVVVVAVVVVVVVVFVVGGGGGGSGDVAAAVVIVFVLRERIVEVPASDRFALALRQSGSLRRGVALALELCRAVLRCNCCW